MSTMTYAFNKVRKHLTLNKNHINAIEKKINQLHSIESQLDLFYGNALRYERQIISLEGIKGKIEATL